MAFTIQQIQFRNFRNYKELTLSDFPELTLLVGENAVGKTNILEGIQLLSSAQSFRHPQNRQLIKEGEEVASLAYNIANTERQLHIELQIREGRKVISSNGKTKKSSDIKGLLPSVMFTPADLEAVQGSQTHKRELLDALGSQLSANYHSIQQDYENIIKQKNKILKDEESDALLDSINELLLKVGTQFCYYRQALSERLQPYLQENYRKSLLNYRERDEILLMRYVPSFLESKSDDSYEQNDERNTVLLTREEIRWGIAQQLQEKRAEERIRHKALIGPHSDKLLFYLNGKNAGIYGSQGQQRTIILAWKIAEVELINTLLQTEPIVLLDDVMSELDVPRRRALMRSLQSCGQVFISATELGYFDESDVRRAKIIQLPQE